MYYIVEYKDKNDHNKKKKEFYLIKNDALYRFSQVQGRMYSISTMKLLKQLEKNEKENFLTIAK